MNHIACTPRFSTRPAALAAACAAACVVLLAPGARAATITRTFDVPITFTGPTSTRNNPFTVAGFDPALGTLTGVSVSLNTDYGTSTLDTTIRNDGSSTVSGSGAYSESESVRLLRTDTNVSLSSNTGSSSAYGGFSLAPGQQTTIRAFGTGGGGSGGITSANRSYFSRTGGGDVPLAIQSIGTGYSFASGLTVVSQTGQIDTDAYGSITYTYNSSNTTPPASAKRIAISSSTTDPLAAGQIRFYVFDYAGGALTIDTIGSNLMSSNDTEIGLYSSTGNRVAQNDDATGLGRLSKISYANGALATGTYYLAVGGYDSTFATSGFDASSTSSYTGTVQVNLNGTPLAVPEPMVAGGVAALFGLVVVRRRAGLPV